MSDEFHGDGMRLVLTELERMALVVCDACGDSGIAFTEDDSWGYYFGPCRNCLAGKHVSDSLSHTFISRVEPKYYRSLPYQEYLRTDHWKEKRRGAVERAGDKCQLCNQQTGLDVHHKTYERLGEERDEDLIALCRYCHAKFHDRLAVPS